jgi:hypothetical protein
MLFLISYAPSSEHRAAASREMEAGITKPKLLIQRQTRRSKMLIESMMHPKKILRF